MNNIETKKIIEFTTAMQKHSVYPCYKMIPILLSYIITILQMIAIFNLHNLFVQVTFSGLFYTFIISYIIADFINGLIHMFMDNNTNYNSIVGPFIADFHLHHKKIKYKNKHPLKVYFFESGNKFWMFFYMIVVLYLQKNYTICYISFFLVFFGTLSCFAELSHYWCHNSVKNNKIINKLQVFRLLLSKTHHAKHHKNDNTNYAFLNGITDPIINIIAKRWFKGYKNNSDKHATAYMKNLKI